MAREKITDRIDKILQQRGRGVPFHELADALYGNRKSAWRSASHGGPPGCYMALSAAIRRYGYGVAWPNGCRANGRIIYPRSKSDDCCKGK